MLRRGLLLGRPVPGRSSRPVVKSHTSRVRLFGRDVKNDTYRNHGTHAEASESFQINQSRFPLPFRSRQFSGVFISPRSTDPTTLNQQGNDRAGLSYGPDGDFSTSPEQEAVAEDTTPTLRLRICGLAGTWSHHEVTPAGDFGIRDTERHQDNLNASRTANPALYPAELKLPFRQKARERLGGLHPAGTYRLAVVVWKLFHPRQRFHPSFTSAPS